MREAPGLTLGRGGAGPRRPRAAKAAALGRDRVTRHEAERVTTVPLMQHPTTAIAQARRDGIRPEVARG